MQKGNKNIKILDRSVFSLDHPKSAFEIWVTEQDFELRMKPRNQRVNKED